MLWDYLVFIIFVIASSFVAVYSRFFGPKEKTKADFVFATGKVSMAAMMLSIARGTLGVRSFLGKLLKFLLLQRKKETIVNIKP